MAQANPFDYRRKIARLNDLLERATRQMERAFGRSHNCIMGNQYEYDRWARIKNNEPELANFDDAGKALLPTWSDLTNDLYSALRRTATVLYDDDQIAPTHRGNRKLLAPVVEGEEWDRIHDMCMGDDNMSVIAALRIEEGWISELKRQEEEAKRRKQEQEERAEQRRQEREREKQEKEEQEKNDQPQGGAEDRDQDAEAGGDDTDQDESTGPGAAPGAAQSGPEAPAEMDRDNGAGPSLGDEGDETDADEGEGAGGGAAAGGSGAGAQGQDGGAQPADGPGFHGEPEPNNAIEAAGAGAAHAAAAQEATLALEEAQRLAEGLQGANGEGDIDAAIAAAEAALRAAEDLVEGSEEAEERILAQEAYDEMTEGARPAEALRKAVRLAQSELKDQQDALRAWGIGKGDLQKMNPQEVLELMKLLRNPELKKLADLLGYQKRMVQKRPARDRYAKGPTIRVGVEQGRRVERMLSSQKLLMAAAPTLFAYRYVNSQLTQHKTVMEEMQERGDGWFEIDMSGSMYAGSPFTYIMIAKACAITCMDYFHDEGRNCYILFFDDGVREVIKVPAGISNVELLRLKLQVAQTGYGGGTDFYEPLLTALQGIKNGVDYWDKSSIVMITDGQCAMSPQQAAEIKKLQDEQKVDIMTWLMPGGSAAQMKAFGPVESLSPTLESAGEAALKIVTQLDAPYSTLGGQP